MTSPDNPTVRVALACPEGTVQLSWESKTSLRTLTGLLRRLRDFDTTQATARVYSYDDLEQHAHGHSSSVDDILDYVGLQLDMVGLVKVPDLEASYVPYIEWEPTALPHKKSSAAIVRLMIAREDVRRGFEHLVIPTINLNAT